MKVPAILAAQGLSQVEQQIVQYVDAHNDDAIALLERIVNVNSGTMNPEGVQEVGQILRAEFDALGFATRWISLPETNRGGHLFAETEGGQGKTILMIGHLDTVFEKDSPFQRWERADDVARGPGVEDMKGGDVVMLYAIKALEAAGVLEDLNIIVAYTGDEEDPGDPVDISRRDMVEAAKRADVVLGFEGGVGSAHSATIARRGYTDWYLGVSGERGHSSLIFTSQYGAGAINEAARILNSFYQELGGEEYLTFGSGIILGGTATSYDTSQARGTAFGKTNVIPQTVTVAGDLRTLTFEQRDRAKARMQEIVSRNLPGTSAQISFRDSYPPMAPTAGNQALFDVLDQVSRDMGYGPIEAVDPGRRGAADISFAAPYADALAGLGPYGAGGHTPDEEVDLTSLAVVTKRAAVLIYRLAKEGVGTD
ncbi:MAG: M20/M25/M40 family metallo-hydrolase [Gemmatimonadota bacterium]|nr:MAG: M20/M25/M40 family metallo-hydrolase [Gemmatimonadota bacterium]